MALGSPDVEGIRIIQPSDRRRYVLGVDTYEIGGRYLTTGEINALLLRDALFDIIVDGRQFIPLGVFAALARCGRIWNGIEQARRVDRATPAVSFWLTAPEVILRQGDPTLRDWIEQLRRSYSEFRVSYEADQFVCSYYQLNRDQMGVGKGVAFMGKIPCFGRGDVPTGSRRGKSSTSSFGRQGIGGKCD